MDIIYSFACCNSSIQVIIQPRLFFHRIESCMQPMYALLRLARTTRGAAALVERSGWLSGGLEEVFWTELEPVSELLRYDDRSRGVTQWDGCWDRTGAPLPLICFNVDASAKVLVPGRASQEAPPTEASLLLHADLLRLGLYPQEPRRPLSPDTACIRAQSTAKFSSRPMKSSPTRGCQVATWPNIG